MSDDAYRKGRDVGEKIGAAAAEGVKRSGFAEAVRNIFRALFGSCSRCDAPMSGHSPSGLCAQCHAAIVLEKARGDEPPPAA